MRFIGFEPVDSERIYFKIWMRKREPVDFEVEFSNAVLYSRVPNKRVGWNKHVGRRKMEKLINV